MQTTPGPNAEASRPWRQWWLPMAGLAALVALVAAWSVHAEFRRQREVAAERLQAVAELRDAQVESWLQRHMAPAGFLSTSTLLAELFERWHDQNDAEAGARLLARVIDFRKANGADSALLVGAGGEVLAREHPPGPDAGSAELAAALQRALASGEPEHTGVYERRDTAFPRRMDVVVPLAHTGKPARVAVVLRLDVAQRLDPLLAQWPVPDSNGEMVLWRHDGDRIESQSVLRALAPPSGPASAASLAWAQSMLPLARLLRGEVRPGEAFAAIDYRGRPVLSTVRPISGSDWWLVAKVDQAEIDAPAWNHAAWAGSAALLTLFGLGLGLRLWLQRQAATQIQRERAEHQERLKTLGLLQALTQSSTDAIFAKDLQGRFVLFNRTACEEAGISADQALGLTTADLFGAEVAEALDANDRAALTSEVPLVFEEVLPTPNGPRTKLCTKGALRDADGRLLGLFGVSRDVTEARRAERTLHESEALHRSVIAVLDEGVLVLDAQGRVVTCNAAAERITGVSLDQWRSDGGVPRGWALMRVDGSEMPDAESPVGRALAGRATDGAELLLARDPAGELRWIEAAARPVLSPEDSRVIAAVSSFRDVTERQRQLEELAAHRLHLQELVTERTRALEQANAALQATVRFNRTLTDALPGRVAYWDAGLRCRFANRGWLEWFGKTEPEALGRTPVQILGPEFAAAEDRMRQALQGRPLRFERETRGPQGEQVHQVHYVPDLAADGSVAGLYALAFDITALKNAEGELRRTNAELALARDRAEAANRAKSAFLANMSHEIRTPMNAIIGLTHLMARDAVEAKQRSRLSKVENAAQHLLQIINDILDLSKIEAGKLQLEEAEFTLEAVLARSFALVSDQAREKGLQLVLDQDAPPGRLRGDATRLAQALINLLANAVKFTQQGWVRLRVLRLEETERDVLLRFEVQDTGPGVAPERQSTLFNAFEQADSSTTRRHGGTGLGLALTRHLAHLMHGEVGLSSQPGAGSTFWFSARLHRAAGSEENGSGAALQGLRVLVADELPESLQALAQRLRRIGLLADAAADAAAALRAAQKTKDLGQHYDLLLLDWGSGPAGAMPLLDQLRELLGAECPPAVLLSAFDDPALWQQVQAGTFAAVLLKPITASALYDTLARVLQQPGQGAAAAAAAPAAGPDSEAEALLRHRHRKQRVLLAEDNPINQEVAGELLRNAGLVVELADDGAQAVEMVLSRPYDLVLMDVQMPHLDGLAATRVLRARLGTALPIVAMTAHAFGEDRAACLDAGMNDHVSKPVDPERLFTTLLRWMPPPPDAVAPPSEVQAAGVAPAVQQALGQVPGLDLPQALRNVGGQLGLLVRVLDRFVQTYAGGEAVLGAAAAGAEPKPWRAACHSLRGACATVGALALRDRAQALETALDAAQAGGLAGTEAQAQEARAISTQLRELAALLQRALKA